MLVEVLRVGVDGTDKEINAAEYGAAPPGRRLPRHRARELRPRRRGRPERARRHPPRRLRRRHRAPARASIYGRIGLQDFTTDDVYYERGINLLHGYLTESYVEDARYVFPLPARSSEVGVLLEPMTVAEKGVNQAYEIQRRLKVWRAAPRAASSAPAPSAC